MHVNHVPPPRPKCTKERMLLNHSSIPKGIGLEISSKLLSPPPPSPAAVRPPMSKPRVLLFPFPGPGHVKAFLTLAELLSDAGIDVVFLSTEYNHRRIPNIEALTSRFPSLRFETISDGLPPDQSRSLADGSLYFSMCQGTEPRFRRLIQSYNGDSSSSSSSSPNYRPITCLVTDMLLSSPVDVAEEFGIPVIAFWTCSAVYLSIYFSMPEIIEGGQVPYTDDNPEEEIKGLPLFEGILRRKHLPGVWSAKFPYISFSHALINQTLAVRRASALIINSFHELESPFLTHLSSIFNKIYPIGPLHALSKSKLGDSSASHSALSGFWKEDQACISWLDSQSPKSVIFVSFGSSMKMEASQLREFWHGLINSGKRFLAVLRSDAVHGGGAESRHFVEQLVGETGENGVIVEWAPQERVLSHRAVGGFLTHCGWNSIMESIVSGVPMICWPIIGDQPANSAWIDRAWKIGIERDEKWTRSTVEMMIRKLMDGENGAEIQRSIHKISRLANENVVKGGSSFQNLELLVEDILKLKPCK